MAFVASRALATALLLGCTLLHCSAEETEEGICPANWFGPYRSTCYRVSDDMMSWNQANATGCNNLADGAYLASVTYNNKGYLSKQDAIIDSYFFWVGLRSGDDEWNKGTPNAQKVDYTNWETVRLSEPSGSRATNDDCVTMVPEYDWPKFMPSGHWLDWQCDSGECQYICELRQESDAECPESWTKHNGVCYTVQNETKTYSQAEVHCASLREGATLVTELGYEELDEALSLGTPNCVWIGLRSTPGDDGLLRWASGAEVTETKWLITEYTEPIDAFLTELGYNVTNFEFDCVLINGKTGDELMGNGQLQSFERYQLGAWGAYWCGWETNYLCALNV